METAVIQPEGQSKTRKYLPIAIGVVLSIIILILGFGMVQNLFTQAANVRPQDVVIAEVTQNSAKITWTTDRPTQSIVEYGTSPTSLNFNAPETDRSKDHSVEITLLSPATTYYFQIKVGDKSFDNGGIPWQFPTKSTQESQKVNLTPTVAATPSATVTPASQTSCAETDCQAIKSKLGKGCTTQDYFKCLRKLTGTPTSTP